VASHRPPRGLPPGAPGQAWQARPAVEQDVAPGPPGGRAAPGRRDATQAQHARSVIAAEIVVEKHLTQNQVRGGRKSNRRSQRPRRAPAYVNWYINGYRRRWTSSDPNPTMRPDHGRIAGSCGVLPVTTDYMVDQLWGPRGALQRRAEVRTHENYREVFPLLSASFHGRSRDRCGPRERSPRSMRARWLNQTYSGDRKLFPRVRNRCRIRIVRQRSSTRLFSTVPWYLDFSSFLGDAAVQSRP
jgi:hypothetical protein